jgi:hypothetical protein
MFKRLFASLKNTTELTLSYDGNGRPIAPHFLDLRQPQDASNQQVEHALEWATQWLRSDVETNKIDMRDLVRKCLDGTAPRKETPERSIVRMATSALRRSAERNRHIKSKAALPWAMLRLGPQLDPCEFACELENRLIPVQDFPTVPLYGCDAATCKCWVRVATQREADKSEH